MGRLVIGSTFIILLLLNTSIIGCLSKEDDRVTANDLFVGIEVLNGGVFQDLFFSAKKSLSVYIPYLVMDKSTGFVQNSTIINLNENEEVQLTI